MNEQVAKFIDDLFMLFDKQILIRNTEHDADFDRFMSEAELVNNLIKQARMLKELK